MLFGLISEQNGRWMLGYDGIDVSNKDLPEAELVSFVANLPNVESLNASVNEISKNIASDNDAWSKFYFNAKAMLARFSNIAEKHKADGDNSYDTKLAEFYNELCEHL